MKLDFGPGPAIVFVVAILAISSAAVKIAEAMNACLVQ